MPYLRLLCEQEQVKMLDLFIRDREEGHALRPAAVRYCLFGALQNRLEFFFQSKRRRDAALSSINIAIGMGTVLAGTV